MKTEILKQDLKMLNVALECYMGKDLEEDSNLSRPVKQALKDFEEVIDVLEELKSINNKYLSIQKECDDWYLTVENYKKNLELYKKAFELYISNTKEDELCEECYEDNCIECIKNKYLKLAKEELENE